MIYKTIDNQKLRFLHTLIITIICMVVAFAQPLSVAAEEVDSAPLQDIAAVAVGALAGGFASYAVTSWAAAVAGGATAVVLGGVAIPTAIIIVVLGVLVAIGVSLTVTAIIRALNEYFNLHQADCQTFIDKLVDGFKTGALDIRNKISMSPSLFSYIYDWVKSHIVSSFDEKTSDVNIENAIDGFELYSPFEVLNGSKNDDQLAAIYNHSNYYNIVTVNQSQLDGMEVGDSRQFGVNRYTYVNENTNLECTFTGDLVVSRTQYHCAVDLTQTFIGSENVVYKQIVHWTRADGQFFTNPLYTSNFYFYVPYVYISNSNYKCNFFAEWSANTGSSLSHEPSVRYLNDVEIQMSSGRVYNADRTVQYKIKLRDGSVIERFDGWYNFLYYVMCKSCKLVIVSGSGTTEEDNTEIKYNVTNPYYNAKTDMLKSTANTVAGKVHDGSITDESEGTITMGYTDVVSGVNVNSVADTIAVTSLVGISELSNTEILTDGQTVMPSSNILTVGAAMIIAGNNIRNGLSTITLKFPFDVIPNVRNFLNNLVDDGQPLVADWEIPTGIFGTFPVHLDFSTYSQGITLFRWVFLVSLAIGLLIASKYALQLV